ncbi:MAG: CAP domain-containing protein [Candidatus Nealsonbacteria bacterium]
MNRTLHYLKILFIPCLENYFRPYFLKSKFLLYYVVALIALGICASVFLVSFPKSMFFADVTKNALFALTNQERVGLGLDPLEENIKLNEVALKKAMDMLDNDYFAHSSPTGLTPWYWFKNVGYRYRAAGENLAVGFIDSEEVVDAWIESPSHRANLLNPNFQEIGIAVLTGELNGQETTLVVQSFGSPVEVASPIAREVTTEELVSVTTEEKIEKAEPIVAAAAQFITKDYFNIYQKIVFYSTIFITLALILDIFIHIKVQDKALIVRSLIFLVLLIGVMIFLNREIILQIVPHNFQI